MKPYNWPGVMASIVIAQGLAFLWYGALFGERWGPLTGQDPATVMSAENKEMVFGVMATALWVGGVGWLSSRLGTQGFGGGARLGVGLWLLFAVPLQSFVYTYENRNHALIPIDLGYTLVAFAVVGALVAGLRLKSGETTTAT
jgi:hypothetical protein